MRRSLNNIKPGQTLAPPEGQTKKLSGSARAVKGDRSGTRGDPLSRTCLPGRCGFWSDPPMVSPVGCPTGGTLPPSRRDPIARGQPAAPKRPWIIGSASVTGALCVRTREARALCRNRCFAPTGFRSLSVPFLRRIALPSRSASPHSTAPPPGAIQIPIAPSRRRPCAELPAVSSPKAYPTPTAGPADLIVPGEPPPPVPIPSAPARW
jgi:hypothetical protein